MAQPFAVSHSAALPYCYYDRYAKKVVLRVITDASPSSVEVLFGDPFDYENGQWQHESCRLIKQYCSKNAESQIVWQVELEKNQHSRLKYAFVVELESTTVSGTGRTKFYFSENGVFDFSVDLANESHNHFFFPFIHETDSPALPRWVCGTVWYQIFPDRFYKDALQAPWVLETWETTTPTWDSFSGGTIAGITQKLSYLQALGITGIYLTPIFLSPSNHKYNTEDYFQIDPNFGTKDDIQILVLEAHERGIRIMFDGVFNHAGNTHPFWRDVLQNQEASIYKNYFHIKSFPVSEHYDNYKKMNFDSFAFEARMPKWNTENPDARKYLIDAACYWIGECDIDGWRLDVADELSFDFVRELSCALRKKKPDIYIVGEMWHDASRWFNAGYFDSAMNYPLKNVIIDYFVKNTIDGALFTKRLFKALSRYTPLHNQASFTLLDSHDTERILHSANGEKALVRAAFTMLFMLPGSPCIFYGTEAGISGGADADCRKPMLWRNETRDAQMESFFKGLIEFRKKNSIFITNARIEYESVDSGSEIFADVWHFILAEKRLSFVFAKNAASLDAFEIRFGTCVFSSTYIEKREVKPKMALICEK